MAAPAAGVTGSMSPGHSPLTDDRRQLEAVCNNATVALFIMDECQQCVYMNPAAERLTGYTLAEVRGRPLHDVVHHTRPDGSHYPLSECPIDQAFPQNNQEQGEEVFVHKDGHFYPVAYTASPIREGGRPIGTIIEVRDLTEGRRARAALREQEALLDAVLEAAPAGIIVADPQGKLLRMNPANDRLWGFPPFSSNVDEYREWKGWWADGSERHGRRLEPEEWALARALRGETAPGDVVEIEPFDAPGTRKLMINSGAPVRDPAGRILGGVNAQMEITELRRVELALKESEERFRATFKQAAVGMAQVGTDGRWLRVNQRLCEIVGYPREELLEKTFQEITHPEDLERDLTHVARLLAGESDTYSMEKRYLRKDGEPVWINLTVSLVRDAGGEAKFFIAVVEDISARKAAEAALQSAHQTLRERVDELARSNADLEQFAYVASHDLQEPLRTVSSYTQLLARRYSGQLDPRADKWIGYVVDGAERMQRLIEDLLAYSRVGTRGEALEPVDCEAAFRTALGNLGSAIAEAGAVITHDPLPVVRADAQQLVQLFQNLVGNAVKFRRTATPEVHVTAAHSEGQWVFRVQDNGIGIDPEFAQRIFVIFQRLHARTDYPGTGIGLAICKRIVERHGGQIWIESRTGPGTAFCFSLPA